MTSRTDVSYRDITFLTWWEKRRRRAATADELDIVEALTRMADHGPVAERHVRQLLDSFRRCSLGEQRIAEARAVAGALLRWQDEQRAVEGVVGGAPQQQEPAVEVDDEPAEPVRRTPMHIYRPGIASSPPGATTSTPPVASPIAPAPPPSDVLHAIDGQERRSTQLVVALVVAMSMALLVFFVVSTSSQPPVEVSGAARLEHVGLRVDLPEPWMHAVAEDQDGESDGWKRRWSVFYRGIDARQFDARLTIMVLSRSDGTPATDLDARTIGASETVGFAASRRECLTRDELTECRALYVYGARRHGLYELFYVLDDRVVFVRALYPIELPTVTPSQPGFMQPDEPVLFAPEDAAEIRHIVDSLEPVTAAR